MHTLGTFSKIAVVSLLATGLLLSGCGESTGEDNATENGNTGQNNDETPEVCDEEYQYTGGSIDADLRLVEACSPYDIGSDIRVDGGATLTIDPGVTLQFQDGVDVRIGNSSDGKLIALGTPEKEIVFESYLEEDADAGAWAGIAFRDGTLPGTELEHVVVRHAGQDQSRHSGCVTASDLYGNRLSIDNSTFEHCAQVGLRVTEPLMSFTGNTFRSMSVGIDADGRVLDSIAADQLFEDVDRNQISHREISTDTTVGRQDIPWLVTNDIYVEGEEQPVLTLEAGAHLQFDQDTGMRVGHSDGGGLIIAGGSDEKVVLEGRFQEFGSWGGIVFRPEAIPGSQIDHAIIRDGGEDISRHQGCLRVVSDRDNRVSVTNSEFENCAQAAVDTDSWFDTFDENTFVDTTVAISALAGVVGSISENQSFIDVERNVIRGGDVSEDSQWEALGVHWSVTGRVNVEGNNDPYLTIAEGTELRFDDDTGIRVGHNDRGGLYATDVLFTSSEPGPQAGSWPGIVFRSNTLSGSYLDNVEIAYAGEDINRHDGAVTVVGDAGPRVEIIDSLFRENALVDIYFNCDNPPTFSGNERHDGSNITTPDCV